MVALNITITNRLNVFGPAPSNKWADYLWNSFNWGEGTADLQAFVLKTLSNSIAPDSSASLGLVHPISNSLAPTTAMGSERLKDGSGYDYVFPDDTTEGEDRDFPTWTEPGAAASTWTPATDPSTSWSES
jgi:hypothetical protein